jgi:hypothetical protein
MAGAKSGGVAASAVVQGWRARARSFLAGVKRKAEADDGSRKKHRAGAAHLGYAIDNALQAGTGVGLKHFHYSEELYGACDPFRLRRLCLAPDQASDGVALVNALLYKKEVKLNLQVMWDFSHGGWNDWRQTLKDTGRWGWFLVSVVAMNALHGPWSECKFFSEMSEASLEYVQSLANSDVDCPLLGMYLEDILAESGEAHRISEPNISQLIAEDLKKFGGFRKMGDRVSLNRFFGAAQKFRKELRHSWHKILIGMMYRAITTGHFAKSALTNVVKTKMRSSADDKNGAALSMAAGDDDIKKLRAACKNTLDLVTAIQFIMHNLRFQQGHK